MGFQNKLKDIFFRVSGTNFPDARKNFYEARARDSFNTAMDLMNGMVLPPSGLDKIRGFLNRKNRTWKPVPLKGPELAKKYFEDAEDLLERTEILPETKYYKAVFGISKKEFELEILEAEFQLSHPELLERTKKNDHEFHP